MMSVFTKDFCGIGDGAQKCTCMDCVGTDARSTFESGTSAGERLQLLYMTVRAVADRHMSGTTILREKPAIFDLGFNAFPQRERIARSMPVSVCAIQSRARNINDIFILPCF